MFIEKLYWIAYHAEKSYSMNLSIFEKWFSLNSWKLMLGNIIVHSIVEALNDITSV